PGRRAQLWTPAIRESFRARRDTAPAPDLHLDPPRGRAADLLSRDPRRSDAVRLHRACGFDRGRFLALPGSPARREEVQKPGARGRRLALLDRHAEWRSRDPRPRPRWRPP